jgi:hypothetical protein
MIYKNRIVDIVSEKSSLILDETNRPQVHISDHCAECGEWNGGGAFGTKNDFGTRSVPLSLTFGEFHNS